MFSCSSVMSCVSFGVSGLGALCGYVGSWLGYSIGALSVKGGMILGTAVLKTVAVAKDIIYSVPSLESDYYRNRDLDTESSKEEDKELDSSKLGSGDEEDGELALERAAARRQERAEEGENHRREREIAATRS